MDGADYLSAAATLIGACISLVPIFWLIGQNKLIREQMESGKKEAKQQNDQVQKQIKIQLNQNDADMFLRSCEVLKKDCSDIEMWGALISLKELLEGKNRNLKKDEGLAFYRSQVIIIIERLLQTEPVDYIENYKMCFYILKEGIVEQYLDALTKGSIKEDQKGEALGNIKRCLLLFLSEFTLQKNAEKRVALYKIAIKTIASKKDDAIDVGGWGLKYINTDNGNGDEPLHGVILKFVKDVFDYISKNKDKLDLKEYENYIKKCEQYKTAYSERGLI